jgi:hypothetical protein
MTERLLLTGALSMGVLFTICAAGLLSRLHITGGVLCAGCALSAFWYAGRLTPGEDDGRSEED